ncbi:hypothetical protein CKA32_003820 [Geitlerinema sp. FC II]|nr:hypothetical protein [Geitlerinema sp. CS-897]PPT05955.1 hypothetical protein CKA32_003820 [Geitlerinema sp. FC II]
MYWGDATIELFYKKIFKQQRLESNRSIVVKFLNPPKTERAIAETEETYFGETL